MRIGLFGGTFDPPHKAHVAIVENAINILDKIIIMPNRTSPEENKTSIAPAGQRTEMLNLVFNHNKVTIDDFEINSKNINYTYNSLKYLVKKYNKDNIVLIIGEDQINKLSNWYNADWILNHIEILCFKRTKTTSNFKTNFLKVRYVDFDMRVSSTDIRNRIKNNRDVENVLSKDVYNYILKKGLYK
tara:strand:+ start:143 stop:703 length:561 start_codon:yes stop_codon:yes gene_type:complete